MSNQGRVTSASQLNEVIFRKSANDPAVRRFFSLFPGLGYAAAYKVLQRVYKYGGQPFVRDYLAKHHGDSFDRTFGKGNGKFTFSAADSGEHRLCVTPQNVEQGGAWFGSGIHGTVKFTLDLAIGETSKIESTDKGKIDDLAQKLRDLNSRMQDVRREQVFQRVSLVSKEGLLRRSKMLTTCVCSRSERQSSATSLRARTRVL